MKSRPLCPKCRLEIPLEDINVSTDIALCRKCGQSWSYADILADQSAASVDFNRPPAGAWFRQFPPNGFETGSTTRSAAAFFLVPFMCVWSGFSLGGIYGTQVVKGHFSLGQSLFGIPFILGTLLFGGLAVMTVCGKVYVRVDGNEAVAFTGVGPLGFRRRFKWSGVTAIRATEQYGRRGQPSRQITIEGEKRIDFGSGLKPERLDFILAALKRMQR
jgi:hypothetical protein